MEHLFHPWHYAPFIAAAPFLVAAWHYYKHKLWGNDEADNNRTED